MKNTVAEVSYVGNHGLHIWRLINGGYNAVLPQFRAQVAAGRGRRPRPEFRRFGFANGVTRDESTGDSNYHALQVWIDRRFTDRLAFQTAYTWSHTISNVPTQSYISATTDVFNYDLDRGDADLDRRHSLVFNAVYALPAFKEWGVAREPRLRRLAVEHHRLLLQRHAAQHHHRRRPGGPRQLDHAAARISFRACPSTSTTPATDRC